VHFLRQMLADRDRDLDGLRAVVSGSGNVALHAMEKLVSLGARVVGCSDSRGSVSEPDGVDVDLLREVKSGGGSVADYAGQRPDAETSDASVFALETDVALPCATQDEIDVDEAKALVASGCLAVVEGANGPVTPAARHVLTGNGVGFGPGKAANAGGVAVSALEMAQDAQRVRWTRDDVDQRLEHIMTEVHGRVRDAAERWCGDPEALEDGANAAGFLRVAEAVQALGVV
jgi:glutamate dehydrogenase (NADP+)